MAIDLLSGKTANPEAKGFGGLPGGFSVGFRIQSSLRRFKRSQSAVLILGGFTLILGFQNCAKAQFSGGSKTTSSIVSISGDSGTVSGGGDGVSSSGPVVSDDAGCSQSIANQSVLFDSDPNAGAAEIQSAGNFAGYNLDLVAGKIDRVQSFAVYQVNLNAQSIGQVSDFAASSVKIVAHQINEVTRFASFACLNVQSLSSIHDLAGGVSIFGRSENGVLAQVGSVARLAGIVKLHSVNLSSLNGTALVAYFENSHISNLSQGAGELYLTDTVIDSVSNFSGIIHLKGSSKIVTQSSSSVRIIQE